MVGRFIAEIESLQGNIQKPLHWNITALKFRNDYYENNGGEISAVRIPARFLGSRRIRESLL